MSTTPATARRGLGRDRSPSVPSTARIGEVRPARLAGHSAPTTDLTDRDLEDLTRDHDEPVRERDPEAEAEGRPDQPQQRGLDQDRARDHPPRRAERAQHPDLADALEHRHVERVEDEKAADEQRHRREEVEDHVEGLKLGFDLVGLLLGRVDLRAPLEPVLEAAAHVGDRVLAARDREQDLVVAAWLVHQVPGGAERHRREALAAEVEPGLELEHPHDLQPRGPRRRREPDAVADVDLVGVGPALLEIDLPAALGLAARDRLGVAEVGRPRRPPGDVEGLAGDLHLGGRRGRAAGDGRALGQFAGWRLGRLLALGLLDQVKARLDAARGVLDALGLPHLAQRRRAQRARRLRARDDEVGASVDGVEEIAEGALDRRAEQQNPEDHRDPEDDPRRGQQRAQPPGSELARGEARERAHQLDERSHGRACARTRVGSLILARPRST
jgi:hypothetical protein